MNGALRIVVVSVGALMAAAAHSGSRPTEAQTVRMDEARATAMRDHYSRAMALHQAVIRGDLTAITPAAAALSDYEGPATTAARAAVHVAAIRTHATAAAKTQDIGAAAYATALLLTACGDCHRTVGTMPAAALPARPDVGGVVGHMLAHQRAADQMLQGLIVPSNSQWREGTRAFVSAPLHPADLPVTSAERRQLAPVEERIHRLASDAVQATDTRARASFYGQMLAGCADCHRQHAQLWGPKPKQH